MRKARIAELLGTFLSCLLEPGAIVVNDVNGGTIAHSGIATLNPSHAETRQRL